MGGACRILPCHILLLKVAVVARVWVVPTRSTLCAQNQKGTGMCVPCHTHQLCLCIPLPPAGSETTADRPCSPSILENDARRQRHTKVYHYLIAL